MFKSFSQWPKVILMGISAALFCVGLYQLGVPQPYFPSAQAAVHPTPILFAEAQDMLAYVSQVRHIPMERLLLADVFTRELTLSGHTLWRGWVLDRDGSKQSLHEVTMDPATKKILDNQEMEAMWKVEQAAYRARYGQQVLERIAQQAGVSVARLRIINDVLENYPLTGRIFWQVKGLDTEAMRPFQLAIGPDGVEVGPAVMQQNEFDAHRTRYGRLDPELYYRLQVTEQDKLVPVLIWIRGVDYEWVDMQLAQRYPELAAKYRFVGGRVIYPNGSSVQLEPELFERVWADYNALLNQAHLNAARPLVDFLKVKGYKAQPLELFPGVYAELPKSIILYLNEASFESLGTIYWGTIELHPAMDSVAPT
jgi:hypothetical protein